MPVDAVSPAQDTASSWHCSLAFYLGVRPVRVRVRPDSTAVTSTAPHANSAEEDMFIINLHQRLLPPADVSQPLDHAFVSEQYSQNLASEEGMELLRENWCLLLALLFPCGGNSGTRGGDALTTHAVSLSPDARRARHLATAQTPIEATEACAECPLSAEDLGAIRDPGTLDRVYFSFVVFLRFFGWRVHDEQRGVLDRHRSWCERYRLLQPGAESHSSAQTLPALLASLGDAAPAYDGSFNFYDVAVTRVVLSLLSVGLVLFAVRLVEFLLEEMKADRLLALLPLVEQRWLPLLASHEAVDSGHVKRLQKAVYRLTHSDSD